MVCLSVRTGWDLYLRAMGLAEGDEVLASAVTHPDMARIARAHGLRVVPVDLDPRTLAPRMDRLAAARTERTRVVLVAHLFGGRVDLEPVAGFAAEHGLTLVEDCAQAFAGPDGIGHTEADASLYSFGTLKTATALGGAILEVKDARALARMQDMARGYPVQGRRAYARRLLGAGLLVCARGPRLYGLLFAACQRLGVDVDDLLGRTARAFPAEESVGKLLRRIRARPSAPLLASLARRLERFDTRALAARAAAGDRLSRALDPSILQPGSRCGARTHWLFPVVVRNPDDLVRGLRGRGFDASRATSSIGVLRPSEVDPDAVGARRMMDGVVFLPAYPALPETDRQRLASVVNKLAVPLGEERRATA